MVMVVLALKLKHSQRRTVDWEGETFPRLIIINGILPGAISPLMHRFEKTN
jgi:hypothetical protein